MKPKRITKVSIRLTQEEREKLLAAAQAEGLCESTWMRRIFYLALYSPANIDNHITEHIQTR